MSRILQAANFVAPNSGGIRTVLAHLADGYAAAGHEVVQVVPGPAPATEIMPWGRRLVLPGMSIPTTGYRVMSLESVVRVAAELRPDRIEVHDRSTLRGVGRWASAHGISTIVVSHERLDRLAAQWLPDLAITRRITDSSNATLAAAFDTVVCTTNWAAQEFRRIEVPNLEVIPLGVDTQLFRPGVHPQMRRELAPQRRTLLALTSRMSREKRPDLAVRAVAELVRRREPVVLAVAGDGPLRRRMQRLARGLPVIFTGHLGREEVARLLASADVVIAPGPVETFGLAALEALACGTPVVGNGRSALAEVLGSAGGIVGDGSPAGFADAIQAVLRQPEQLRRASARARAECFDWSRTVGEFLDAHAVTDGRARAGAA